MTEALEPHRAGKVRVKAVAGAPRAPQLPEVPTLREQGVAVDASAWFAMYGPGALPPAQARRISLAVQTALKEPVTARWQYRLGGAAEEPINSRRRGSTTPGLPPEHPTLPSLLQGAGDRTALIGKWHLGYPPAFGPLKSGYDSFFGPISGGVDYFTHCVSRGSHDLWLGEAEHAQPCCLTDLITDRAVAWLGEVADAADAADAANTADTADTADTAAAAATARENAAPFFLRLHYTAHPTGPGKPATTRRWRRR